MASSPYGELTRSAPLFLIFCAYAAGVVLAKIGLFGILFGLAGIVLMISAYSRRFVGPALLLLFALIGGYGFLAERTASEPNRLRSLIKNAEISPRRPVRFTAVLVDEPRTAPDGVILHLRLREIRIARRAINASGAFRLSVPTKTILEEGCGVSKLHAGNTVSSAAVFNREERFHNPGGTSIDDVLDGQGIDATAAIKSCRLLTIVSTESTPYSYFYRFREWFVERVVLTHDTEAAGVVIASMAGTRSFLDSNSARGFRESGTFHVLVISGLHITVIGGVFLWLFRRMGFSRVSVFFASAVALWGYSIVVGAQLPVLRASIMFTAYLVSDLLSREGNPLNSIAIGAMPLLVWRPQDLFNASFLLTVLSVASITCFALPLLKKIRSAGSWFPNSGQPLPPINRRWFLELAELLYWSEAAFRLKLSRSHWKCEVEKSMLARRFSDGKLQLAMRFVFEAMFVSGVVTLFLMPLMVVNFHRIGIAPLFANVVSGAEIALRDIAAILAVLISLIDVDSAVSFAGMCEFLVRPFVTFRGLAAELPFGSARIPIYSDWRFAIYFAYYLPLAVLVVIQRTWTPFEMSTKNATRLLRGALAMIAVFLVLVVSHPFSASRTDGLLRVDFIDVGQGDSTLVSFPNGKRMLVDGGGEGNFGKDSESEFKPDRIGVGERVVSEFLWESGISSIDVVVATHPDADHIQGLEDVLRNFEVGVVLASGDDRDDPDFLRLVIEAQRRSVPMVFVREGDFMNFGETRVEVLNPRLPGSSEKVNSDSIVLRITFGNKRILLTGDIEGDAERRLLENPSLVRADVIKVPHHGSRTSSTESFIEAVSPQIAIIPAPVVSRFKHPHKEVVERWISCGASVYQTGFSGTITVTTDGHELRLNTFLQERID